MLPVGLLPASEEKRGEWAGQWGGGKRVVPRWGGSRARLCRHYKDFVWHSWVRGSPCMVQNRGMS